MSRSNVQRDSMIKRKRPKWYKVCSGCPVSPNDIPGNIQNGTYRIRIKNKRIVEFYG